MGASIVEETFTESSTNWQWSDANFIIEGGVTLGHWRRFISDFAFTIGLQSDGFWHYIKEYDITIRQEQWFLSMTRRLAPLP